MKPNVPSSPRGCELHDWSLAARDRTCTPAASRGVILDLDDTLYARETFVKSGFVAVARYVLTAYGVPMGDALDTLRAAQVNAASIGREFQALCVAHDLGDRVLELRDVFRAHAPILRLPRTAVAVLGHLRATGWRVVVLTNGLPAVQRRKVAALGIAPLVEAVLYADEIAPGGKPHPEVFDAALSQLGLTPDRCVCVGDNIVCDIAGARACGLRTVWLRQAGTPAGDKGGADVSIGSLGELPHVLTTLLSEPVRRETLVKKNAA